LKKGLNVDIRGGKNGEEGHTPTNRKVVAGSQARYRGAKRNTSYQGENKTSSEGKKKRERVLKEEGRFFI